ncbi:hypothetical protein AGMMS50229_13220 [Campylobacterota bacterium]|nr:hypothetical protein AGMMS50229_13220 [Campylobacterota bacterium]
MLGVLNFTLKNITESRTTIVVVSILEITTEHFAITRGAKIVVNLADLLVS